MQPIKLNLVETNESLGIKSFLGTMKLKDIFNNYKVPFYEPGQDLNVGYQRQAKYNRIKNLGKRISDEETMFEPFMDCVHVNLRSDGALNFIRPLNENNSDGFYTFDYTSDFGKFYVVDGQTRLRGAELAYKDAIEANNYSLAEKIANIKFPFQLSITQNKISEAYRFHILNYHNAPLPTAGGFALMKHGFEEGSEHFKREIELLSKSRDIYSYQLAERLNNESDVWAGEMKDFNDNNPRKISLLSVSRIIKPIMKKYFTKSDDVISVKEATYSVIDAYWIAIKKLYPQMFAPKTKSQFNILLPTSAEIMMKVLSAFLNDQFQKENTEDLTNPETYKKFLVNLRNVKDVNKSNNKVTGQDIFRVGPDGAIGKYSSAEGKRQMARQIYLTLFPNKEIVF